MPKFDWSGNKKHLTDFWGDEFRKFIEVLNAHDGPIVDEKWLDKEVYAIGKNDLGQFFLDKFNSGVKYKNTANSSVAYFLGFTDEAPDDYPTDMTYGVGRVSPPDVDIDTDDRDWMIEYSKRKYGSNRVAQIATFAAIKPKSAIRDAARILGYEVSMGDRIAKMVPDAVLGVDKTMDEVLATPDVAKLYASDSDAKIILDTAKGVEGKIRSSGLHAAAVLIAKSDLTDYIPIQVTGKDKDILATQVDMIWAERLGLLKMDFLGLRNLRVIADCIDSVNARLGLNVVRDEIPLDDAETYKVLRSGESVGMFQIESPGMQSIMTALKPDRFYDIMALIALFRPGPLGSGMHKMYIDRKNGRTKIEYPHPSLSTALEKSLGIMLYQEDVLNVVTTLTGWPMSKADALRKVIGKKEMKKVHLYRGEFVEDAVSYSSISEAHANKIYSDIEYFAGYGFNLAHSCSYAFISYITAYLKTHYTVDYMAALLTSVANDPDKLSIYLEETERLGIDILQPAVGRSKGPFSVESDNSIRYGLSGIRGIGGAIIPFLEDLDGNYENVYQLFRDIEPEHFNSKTIDNLVNAGALDHLSPVQEKRLDPKVKREILSLEVDALGVYLSGHPLEDVEHVLSSFNPQSIEDLFEEGRTQKATVCGLLTSITKKSVKGGKANMYIMRLEDMTGSCEIIVFPQDFPEWEGKFTVGDIAKVSGTFKVDDTNENNVVAQIRLKDYELIDIDETGPPIHIYTDKDFESDTLKRMNSLIGRNPGNSSVFIHSSNGEFKIVYRFNKKCDTLIEDNLKIIGATQI